MMQAMQDSIRAREDGDQALAKQMLAQYFLTSAQQVSASVNFCDCKIIELQRVPLRTACAHRALLVSCRQVLDALQL